MMQRIALHTRLKPELLEVADDDDGSDRGLRLVWELP
jgi:hypothetical protein